MDAEVLREALAKAGALADSQPPERSPITKGDLYALGLSGGELEELIVAKARLWLDAGTMFGAEGEGFQRVNAACPRVILRQALERLESAVKEIL